MSFQLKSVTCDSDFAALVKTLDLSFQTPFLPFLRIMLPVWGTDPAAHEGKFEGRSSSNVIIVALGRSNQPLAQGCRHKHGKSSQCGKMDYT